MQNDKRTNYLIIRLFDEISAVTNTPTIGTWAAWYAARKLQSAGCDLFQVLQGCGLEESTVARTNNRIGLQQNLMLFEVAAQHLGNEEFGLELGHNFDITSIGPVACAMAASSTLREANSVLGLFHRLIIDSPIVVSTLGEGGEISVELMLPESDRAHIRQFSDFFVAGMIANFSQLVCKPLAPAHIALPYKHTGGSSHYQQVFGGPVSYGEERLRIVFSAENADLPIPSRDDSLRAAMLKYCDGLLNSRSHHGNAFIRELERLTLELLPVNQAKAKIVATNLGVSERTLQRRLAETSQTFSTFVDNLRHELALEHLQANEISLGEIAFVLGYGSQSAFQTAFKRWTGQTPSQYRKKIRAGSHLG